MEVEAEEEKEEANHAVAAEAVAVVRVGVEGLHQDNHLSPHAHSNHRPHSLRRPNRPNQHSLYVCNPRLLSRRQHPQPRASSSSFRD